MQNISVNVNSNHECTFLFGGDLTIDLVQELTALVNKHKNEDSFILDFSNVKFFDSSGIGAIIEMREVVKDGYNAIRFINVSDQLKQKFEKFQITGMFQIS